MSITTKWDKTDSSIVVCTIHGEWTWEEYHEATTKIAQMINRVSHRVDMVMDMSEAGPLPMSAASLHIKSSLERMPSHFGVSILVSPDRFTRMVVESLDRVLPMAKDRFYMADTINVAKRNIYLLRGSQFDDGLDSNTRPVFPSFS